MLFMNRSDLPFFPPAGARVHEVCGPGAYAFAFMLASGLGGKLLFVRDAWEQEQINPNGFADFVDPSDLMICHTRGQTETLATAEEALRSGVISLVVMALTNPLGLTEGRRLQLAARAGKAMGLCLISEGMGSNAAETRWHCKPLFDEEDSTLMRWEINKNKSGTLGAWHVRWNRTSHRLNVVSPARERPISAYASN